jgi:hypothetical protein
MLRQLSPDAPFPGGAGLGIIGFPARQNLVAEVLVY